MRHWIDHTGGMADMRRSGARASRLGIGAAIACAVLLAATACAPTTTRPQPNTTPAPGIQSANPTLGSSEVFPGGLYLDTENHAAQAERALAADGDPDAAAIEEISSQPTAIWLGDQYTAKELPALLDGYVASAKADGSTLVFVLYAIPNRDCGGLSAGGLTAKAYSRWSDTIASTLAGSHAVIIMEPDSLAMLTSKRCESEASTRPALIRSAVDRLVAAGLSVYLDAGNSNWVKPATMATLLRSAGVSEARGFFTNVSNFYRVDQERSYADTLSGLLDGAHFVIDVSRNGNGWKGTWCNPTGAALGQPPHVSAGTTDLDALLWVKHPGDSDGTCNGGPKAGVWWEKYALDLVENR